VVSLVAALLALALGIVIGTTALNGPVTADLRHQVSDLKANRSALTSQITTLHGQLDTAGQFATTFGTRLVSGTLPNKKVLLVALPGASTGMTDGIRQQLTAAGASITGQLQLAAAFIDPAHADDVTNLATGPAHPLGLTLPPTSDPRVLGAALLSYGLVGKGQPTDLRTILSGFSGLHMITSGATDVEPAPNIVVLTNGSQPGNPYGGDAEYDLVAQLVAAGASVVVAGDAASAAGNGVVALTRTGSVKSSASTVDDADTAFGQVSTVLTLAATIGSQSGHYGTAKGAEALFPTSAK
jgi:hypothetical protein